MEFTLAYLATPEWFWPLVWGCVITVGLTSAGAIVYLSRTNPSGWGWIAWMVTGVVGTLGVLIAGSGISSTNWSTVRISDETIADFQASAEDIYGITLSDQAARMLLDESSEHYYPRAQVGGIVSTFPPQTIDWGGVPTHVRLVWHGDHWQFIDSNLYDEDESYIDMEPVS